MRRRTNGRMGDGGAQRLCICVAVDMLAYINKIKCSHTYSVKKCVCVCVSLHTFSYLIIPFSFLWVRKNFQPSRGTLSCLTCSQTHKCVWKHELWIKAWHFPLMRKSSLIRDFIFLRFKKYCMVQNLVLGYNSQLPWTLGPIHWAVSECHVRTQTSTFFWWKELQIWCFCCNTCDSRNSCMLQLYTDLLPCKPETHCYCNNKLWFSITYS